MVNIHLHKRHFERGKMCNVALLSLLNWGPESNLNMISKYSLSDVHIKSPSEWYSNLGELIGESLRTSNREHKAVVVKEAPNTATLLGQFCQRFHHALMIPQEETHIINCFSFHHCCLGSMSPDIRILHTMKMSHIFSHFASFKCRHSEH